jgi:hypothetical protein
VFDYDRLCPTDDLLGTAEVFFSEEAIETDPTTGGEKVRIARWSGCGGTGSVFLGFCELWG